MREPVVGNGNLKKQDPLGDKSAATAVEGNGVLWKTTRQMGSARVVVLKKNGDGSEQSGGRPVGLCTACVCYNVNEQKQF